jgi:hypothetical protein
MKKFTLGFICHGKIYTEMTIVAFYSLYLALSETSCINEIIEEILVVTDEPDNAFIVFAKTLHSNVRIISPSNWSKSGLPSYNGNFATYSKLDLFFNLPKNKTMIYLDSDAFVVGKIDLTFIANRIHKSRSQDSILMVPSHRPVIEKIGFIDPASPFNYFNAGFMIVTLRNKFTMAKLRHHLRYYYPKSYEVVTNGDQDLINSYFRGVIEPLPLRYNSSTGMLRKFNFKKGHLNYLVLSELKQAVIAHASGGILQSKKYYPYRKLICDISEHGMNNRFFNDDHIFIFKKMFLSTKHASDSKINKIRQFFGLTQECSPRLYADDFYWRQILIKLAKRLGIRN